MALRGVLLAALGISIALILTSLAARVLNDLPSMQGWGELFSYFDALAPENLPTWWSTSLLVAALLAHVGAGATGWLAGAREAWCWFVGAGVLALLSLQDQTGLYALLAPLDLVLLPGALAALGVGLALALLIGRVRGRVRWLLVVGWVTLVVAAVTGKAVPGLLAPGGSIGVLAQHAEELAENVAALLLAAAAGSAVRRAHTGTALTIRYRAPEMG